MTETAHLRRSLPPLVFGVVVLAIFGVWMFTAIPDACIGDLPGRSILVPAAFLLAVGGEAYFAHRRGAGTIKTICWGLGTAVVAAFLMLVINWCAAAAAGCYL